MSTYLNFIIYSFPGWGVCMCLISPGPWTCQSSAVQLRYTHIPSSRLWPPSLYCSPQWAHLDTVFQVVLIGNIANSVSSLVTSIIFPVTVLKFEVTLVSYCLTLLPLVSHRVLPLSTTVFSSCLFLISLRPNPKDLAKPSELFQAETAPSSHNIP